MSFSSSARTARDPTRPTGYRVRALHQCIEAFQLFGWDGTRFQLARVVGVRDGRWSDEQVLSALDLLARTRASWVVFVQQALREDQALARTQPALRGRGAGALFHDWRTSWLAEPGHAELWGVAHHGACPDCGHPLALHLGTGWCPDCRSDPARPSDRMCTRPSPLLPPAGRSSASTRWTRLAARVRRGTGS